MEISCARALQLEIICNPWDKGSIWCFHGGPQKQLSLLAQRIHGVDGAEDVFYVGSVRRVYEATCSEITGSTRRRAKEEQVAGGNPTF